MDVTVLSSLPPKPKGLSQAATIGIGVGVGVGGALLVGGIIALVISRRRRMSVEPRDHMA